MPKSEPESRSSVSATSEPVALWVRVRDRSTGHEYDVAGSAVDPDAHVRVNAPAAYPDLHRGRPRPIKFRTDMAGRPVATDNQES